MDMQGEVDVPDSYSDGNNVWTTRYIGERIMRFVYICFGYVYEIGGYSSSQVACHVLV